MARSGNILKGDRVTHRVRICQQIQDLIVENRSGVGERLPSVETLAKRFKVSVGTLHLALTDLEAKGVINKRRGAGVFVASPYAPVTMRDTVAVCMESGTHLYGELWEQLMVALQACGLLPLGLDIRAADAGAILDRLPMDQMAGYMLHANDELIRRLVSRTELQGTPVLAFFDAPELPDNRHYYRIIRDRKAVAAVMIKHLRSMGYKQMVLLGQETDEYAITHPGVISSVAAELAREWDREGVKWSFLRSQVDQPTVSAIRFEEDKLLALVRATKGRTAIVGARDVETWEAQQVLRRRAPELEDRLEFYGFFDTPWSRAGSPPFTTVSLDILGMVTVAMEILDAVKKGLDLKQRSWMIPPKLVKRG
jgi:DNA-binding LacI/PurR family transcriptional regulator